MNGNQKKAAIVTGASSGIGKAIAEMLSGLKRYEWSRLKIAIERMYDSASCKLPLGDAESIQKNIALEMKDISHL